MSWKFSWRICKVNFPYLHAPDFGENFVSGGGSSELNSSDCWKIILQINNVMLLEVPAGFVCPECGSMNCKCDSKFDPDTSCLKNYTIRNCRGMLALPDGRLFFRKSMCDFKGCHECLSKKFLLCKDPSGNNGYWVRMSIRDIPNTTRKTSKSKPKRGQGNTGKEFMVFAIQNIDF